MGWYILKQPDGRYARFSSIVDTFTHVGMTREEALDVCLGDVGRRDAEAKVRRADDDCTIYSPVTESRPGDGLNRWRETLETIERIHGKRKAKAAAREAVRA